MNGFLWIPSPKYEWRHRYWWWWYQGLLSTPVPLYLRSFQGCSRNRCCVSYCTSYQPLLPDQAQELTSHFRSPALSLWERASHLSTGPSLYRYFSMATSTANVCVDCMQWSRSGHLLCSRVYARIFVRVLNSADYPKPPNHQIIDRSLQRQHTSLVLLCSWDKSK